MIPKPCLWLGNGGNILSYFTEIIKGSKLIKIYQQSVKEPNPIARGQLLAKAVRVHIDEGPFKLGLVANQPALATARNNLRNIPNFGITAPWTPGAPGSAQPQLWYFEKN